MKEITLNIDGKEIKATVSEEELEKLTTPEPSVRRGYTGFAGSMLKKTRENEHAKKEWPQVGDRYWWTHGGVRSYIFENDDYDRALETAGNFYRTEQEALDAVRAQKLIAAIAKRRKELNGGWKPDWEDGGAKWSVTTYSYGILGVDMRHTINWASPFGVYEEYESAETIIKEFHDELLWFFTEYVVSVN